MGEVIDLLEKALKILRDEPPKRRPIAWGAKVSPVFRERIWWIADTLSVNPDYLMACIAFETGETFSPSVKNGAGSGATGLIQFMPSTAVSLGTSTRRLADMTAEDQLNFVYKYFAPYRGRLSNLGDVYMAILWPKAVGKPDSYLLWDKEDAPVVFRQNAGLDLNGDFEITRGECLTRIQEKLLRGREDKNLA